MLLFFVPLRAIVVTFRDRLTDWVLPNDLYWLEWEKSREKVLCWVKNEYTRNKWTNEKLIDFNWFAVCLVMKRIFMETWMNWQRAFLLTLVYGVIDTFLWKCENRFAIQTWRDCLQSFKPLLAMSRYSQTVFFELKHLFGVDRLEWNLFYSYSNIVSRVSQWL